AVIRATCHSADSDPMPMSSGRPDATNAWARPGALFDIRLELAMPGPHHSFSVETPRARGPSAMRSALCPGSIRKTRAAPMRCGRAILEGEVLIGEGGRQRGG